MAQVRFWVGDLRHKMGLYALWWRRSYHYFHTCAKITGLLPLVYHTISDGMSTRVARRVARSPRRAKRVDQ